MAFTLLQVGGALKSVNSTGAFSAALTLPAGVTLATNLVPRFARFKNYVIVVNTPSRPLSVSDAGVVHVLTPNPPASAVVLSQGASDTLTGTYKAWQTYKILDAAGNTISESDYSPIMLNAFAVTAHALHAAFVISSESVSATQLYRTTDLGVTPFSWARIDGNVVTSYEDNLPDSGLGIAAGANLGSAPDLTLIAEFGGRLWGVARGDVDDLRYTEAGTMYAWYSLNTLPIPHIGSDAAGIVALIPRRAALGVARRDQFVQVTGDTRDNIKPTTVAGGEQMGVLSQESVVVFNDIAYFLWRDGVYKWDSNGIACITNGKVRSWFTSDLYFNRAMFWRAFAQLEPNTLKYRLFLASVGSDVNDRWIEYDLMTGTWWGPHKTDAFTPTCAVLVAGTDQKPYYMVGSLEGYLSQEQEPKNDWDLTSIDFHVEVKSQDMSEPEQEKYFGELSVLGRAQPAGTVEVTPTVGEIDGATASASFTYNMVLGRQRLGRLGVGKQLVLEFDHDTLNQDVEIYGYEVDPVNIVGRR